MKVKGIQVQKRKRVNGGKTSKNSLTPANNTSNNLLCHTESENICVVMCLNTSYPFVTQKWGKMRVKEVQISKVLKYHEVTYQITHHFLSNLKKIIKTKQQQKHRILVWDTFLP